MARQRPLGYYIAFYAALCIVAGLFSIRHHVPLPSILGSPTPAWTLLPPIPYGPHLPPPRHPSISYLTADQKHALEFLKDEGYPSPLHAGKARSVTSLRLLYECVHDPTRQCETTNRGKVIILEADYFRWALYGMTDGEHIWAKSVLKGFDDLGYTVLISESATETNELYSGLSGAVVLVIKTRDEMDKCVESSKKGKLGGCLEGEKNTRGIPVWKLMAMYFFPNPGHPLGTAWTLSPEPYHQHDILGSDARYLGYSIEDACLSVPLVPLEERENRAYILAKYHNYFVSDETSWSIDSFARIAKSTAATFVGGWIDRGNPHQATPVDGVTNLGRLAREQFVHEVSKSKVMIGMGNPVISPTPYEALCLAVPFINPVRDWNRDDPDNRDTWYSQHNGLHELNPPYVYHVHQHDEAALTRAVESALANPIERYVLPRMRQDEVKERVRKMVEEVDWWRKWRELGDEGRRFRDVKANND